MCSKASLIVRHGFWTIAVWMLIQSAPLLAEDLSLQKGKDFVHVCTDANAGAYEAFPDVCRMADGRLLTVFYAGYKHVSLPNADWPRGGRVAYCLSSDEGATWTPPAVLVDTSEDDRDPSITQLKSGRLLCNFFTYPEGHAWLTHSDDAGKTWSEPRKIVTSNVASSPVRVMSTGRLVLPLYYAVVISDDGGETWSDIIKIDTRGQSLSEADVIELKDRTLYAIHRADNGVPMHFTKSDDFGSTWKETHELPFYGHSPYLFRAGGGTILMGYREVFLEGMKEIGWVTTLRSSDDECQTWSEPIRIDDTVGAYPSFVRLKDGSILVVYYEEGDGSSIRARKFKASKAGIEWLTMKSEKGK